jgi:hypothetical protein
LPFGPPDFETIGAESRARSPGTAARPISPAFSVVVWLAARVPRQVDVLWLRHLVDLVAAEVRVDAERLCNSDAEQPDWRRRRGGPVRHRRMAWTVEIMIDQEKWDIFGPMNGLENPSECPTLHVGIRCLSLRLISRRRRSHRGREGWQ